MQMLDAFPVVGGLIPSVVTAAEGRSAKVYGRDGHEYGLPWETGLAWARKNGAAPHQATDIVAVGDVVYVLPNRDGSALLAQVPQADGAISALVGGFDYYASKFNRVVQARRQPGSSFKPFIYSGALEQGFTPATMVLDAPIVIEGSGLEGLWRPENDSRHFYGPTRLRDALARSRNLVSIRILRALGVDYAVDYAQRFGFEPAELPHNLTVALGTAQLTPLEMARGYAVFANGGFRVTPYLIDRVEDAYGKVLMAAHPAIACRECDSLVEPPLPPPPGAPPIDASSGDDEAAPANVAKKTPGANLAPRVISPANAFLMTDLMRDVIRKGTARRALALKRDDIAGKTGTTNDRRDTWFSGFNADIVATAWVGFDQERSLGANEEGGHTALPIWVYFMGEALAGRPEHRLPQPEGIVSARISPNTGALAKPNDPDAIFEFFLTGRLPGAGGLAGDGAGAAVNRAGTSGGEEQIF
jgi:penicillin-binding protein 1A